MPKGMGFPEVAMQIANAINMESSAFAFPWRHHFRTVEMTRGTRIIVEVSDDESVQEVPAQDLVNKLVSWLRLQQMPEWLLTEKRAHEVIQTWMAISDPLRPEDIAPVRWKSEAGLTWRRLPWDIEAAETPTWDKILRKMTNAAAFRQWLGSLFFPEAAQHQYVWVHGMGNDGKGSINRFLKSIFGRCYRSKNPPAPNDKFWTYGLLGARLIVFPDCNSQTFTSSGLFKTITGGDPVDVEAKGKMSFTATLMGKFLFFSNKRPVLSGEYADLRRIIYCAFTEGFRLEDFDPEFEEKLWTEGGAFLSRCVLEYRQACPKHQDIQCSRDDVEALIATNDEHLQCVFDEHFQQTVNPAYREAKNLSGLSNEQFELITASPAEVLAVVLEAFRGDSKSQSSFRDWLYKKYGVQKKAFKRDGRVIYRYVGMHRKYTGSKTQKIDSLYRAQQLGISTVTTE